MTTYRRGELTVHSHRQNDLALLTYRSEHVIEMNGLGDEVVELEAHWQAIAELVNAGVRRVQIDCGIRVSREVKTYIDFDWNGLIASGVDVVILRPCKVVDGGGGTDSARFEYFLNLVENSERLIWRVAVAGLSLLTIWALLVQKASGGK
jgi:hypothetical protein